MSKKKSANGKQSRPNSLRAAERKQTFQRGTPLSRRPPRQPGR